MRLEIEDPDLDALVDELAEHRGIEKAQLMRQELHNDIKRLQHMEQQTAKDKLFIHDFYERYPPTGLKADKYFIDNIYDD